MKTTTPVIRLLLSSLAAVIAAFALGASQPAVSAATPKVGDLAPNFSLKTLDDRTIELKSLAAKRPVLLVVLRGWPGYQCPICSTQVNDYIGKAADFAARGVQVLMVYPGPADQLKAHAEEFLTSRRWPADFLYVIDPDYTFINAYGLRWEAPRETAYPSTFIIDQEGRVRFAYTSKSHGDRINATKALESLAAVK